MSEIVLRKCAETILRLLERHSISHNGTAHEYLTVCFLKPCCHFFLILCSLCIYASISNAVTRKIIDIVLTMTNDKTN